VNPDDSLDDQQRRDLIAAAIISTVSDHRGLDTDLCGQRNCRHPFSDHHGGEDCRSCACTWFDTIGEPLTEQQREDLAAEIDLL
jgi:hypothetical protein